MAKKTAYIKIKGSQNRQHRLDLAHDWSDEWEREHVEIIEEIKNIMSEQISSNHNLRDLFGNLQGLHKQKFNALHNIIDKLDNPTRELIK